MIKAVNTASIKMGFTLLIPVSIQQVAAVLNNLERDGYMTSMCYWNEDKVISNCQGKLGSIIKINWDSSSKKKNGIRLHDLIHVLLISCNHTSAVMLYLMLL